MPASPPWLAFFIEDGFVAESAVIVRKDDGLTGDKIIQTFKGQPANYQVPNVLRAQTAPQRHGVGDAEPVARPLWETGGRGLMAARKIRGFILELTDSRGKRMVREGRPADGMGQC